MIENADFGDFDDSITSTCPWQHWFIPVCREVFNRYTTSNFIVLGHVLSPIFTQLSIVIAVTLVEQLIRHLLDLKTWQNGSLFGAVSGRVRDLEIIDSDLVSTLTLKRCFSATTASFFDRLNVFSSLSHISERLSMVAESFDNDILTKSVPIFFYK